MRQWRMQMSTHSAQRCAPLWELKAAEGRRIEAASGLTLRNDRPHRVFLFCFVFVMRALDP